MNRARIALFLHPDLLTWEWTLVLEIGKAAMGRAIKGRVFLIGNTIHQVGAVIGVAQVHIIATRAGVGPVDDLFDGLYLRMLTC